MQLGFVSAIVPDLSLEEVFAVAHEYGYDCVELMCWPRGKAERRYAGVTHIEVSTLDKSEVARIHNLSRSYGVEISGLGYYPNPLTPDREEAAVASAHLKRVIDAAVMLGLPVVSSFVGRDWKKSIDENWPAFLHVWCDLIAYAENRKIKIAIENCPMLFTADEWPGGKNLAASPAIWHRMFEAIPSEYFGLNYDPSHLLWQHMDYFAPLEEFKSRIFRIHAKDAAIEKDRLNRVGIMAHPLEFHTPRLPGEGDIDWGKFMDVVMRSGYDGPVCVEVEDRRFEGSLEARKRALELSAKYMRQFIPRGAPTATGPTKNL